MLHRRILRPCIISSDGATHHCSPVAWVVQADGASTTYHDSWALRQDTASRGIRRHAGAHPLKRRLSGGLPQSCDEVRTSWTGSSHGNEFSTERQAFSMNGNRADMRSCSIQRTSRLLQEPTRSQ